MWTDEDNNRILVVDDNAGVHDTFDAILTPPTATLRALESEASKLFAVEEDASQISECGFEITHAHSGEAGLDRVRQAVQEGTPFAMAFVDIRMNPGWNGIESVRRYWEVDPAIEVVLCTAYTDMTWREIATELRKLDQYLILRKPFDPIEVRQLAHALTSKWKSGQNAAMKLQDLEIMVEEKTRRLSEMAPRA